MASEWEAVGSLNAYKFLKFETEIAIWSYLWLLVAIVFNL